MTNESNKAARSSKKCLKPTETVSVYNVVTNRTEPNLIKSHNPIGQRLISNDLLILKITFQFICLFEQNN